MAARPIYETENHRDVEAQMLAHVARVTGNRVSQTAPKTGYDGRVYDASNVLIGIIECKHRPDWEDWTTYKISKRKIDFIISCTEILEVPGYLVLLLGPRYCFIDVAKIPGVSEVEPWGRKDRNDPLDMEECYTIPVRFLEDFE